MGLNSDGDTTGPAQAPSGDPSDEDTQPLPVVVAPAPRVNGVLWLVAGALVGVGLLVVLGGGLGSGGGPAPRTPASPSPAAPEATTASTLVPAPPERPAIDLRIGARPGRSVWVEVRRGGPSGPQVFAGVLQGATMKRFRSPGPLWLGVAWAPNVAVTVNGEVVDAPGGTESYRVTARGLVRTPAP